MYDMTNAYKDLHKALAKETRPYYVGLVVIDRERNLIMLGKRREDGFWTGPGGAAQSDENPVQAIIREAFEEANLQIKPRDLKTLPTATVFGGKVCHCFMIFVDSSQLNTHSGNDPDREVARWQWLDLNQPLPAKLGQHRLATINAAKMKLYGLKKAEEELYVELQKAIVQQDRAGIDLNTAEQSQDVMATQSYASWIASIKDLMVDYPYGAEPRDLMLPAGLVLCLAKVDDGVYSAYVKRDDPESGSHGEVLVQLSKMTAEAMVAGLAARGYILPDPILEIDPSAHVPDLEDNQVYSGLYSALKNFKGDLHLHLTKAENDKIKQSAYIDLCRTLENTKV